MSMSDPIADMFTRIRNAQRVEKQSVSMPTSKLKVAIARLLKDEGYIEDFTVVEQKPASMILITLKYWGSRRERRPVITNLKRVSKPGRRIYVSKDEIPWVLSGLGISILTTPQGVAVVQPQATVLALEAGRKPA